VVLKASRIWTGGRVVAFDVNPRVIASLGRLGDQVVSLRRDFLVDEPPRLRLDVVVTDPPWYFDELCSALWFCRAVCREGGGVLASIPPLGTRPGIAEERARLVQFTSRVGLHLVQIKAAELPYLSPPFERNALRAAGIAGAPVDWRRGDLAVFARRGPDRERPTASRSAEGEWCDVTFSAARVRVRRAPGGGFSDPRLSPIVEGDVLPTVSRRDPRRAAARVWTSGNRVFACRGSGIFLVVAKALASGHAPRTRVEEHLGRKLTPAEAGVTAEAAMQITRLVLTEERELWAYAGGTRENPSRVFAS
jgi:hypothetical protein